MKKLFFEFKTFLNKYRLHNGKKPVNNFLAIFYFACLAIFGSFFYLTLFSFSSSSNSYSHRKNNKYKKVIREGVFFNTTEYHER